MITTKKSNQNVPGAPDAPSAPGVPGAPGIPGPDVPGAPGIPGPDVPSAPEAYRLPPSKWFFTFMCMNIPIAGWIYLLAKAFGRKDNQLKDFSRAYLLYKLLFLAVSLVILGILICVGMDIADRILAYMEML